MKLLMLIVLVGCGKSIDDYFLKKAKDVKQSESDPIFREFVESFSIDYKVNVTVPVVLRSIDSQYAGVCIKYSNGYKEVQINNLYWNNLSIEQKEQLIYHELGHCVLNRGHDNSLMPSNPDCPKSIMRSYMFSRYEIENCYLPNYNYYKEEL